MKLVKCVRITIKSAGLLYINPTTWQRMLHNFLHAEEETRKQTSGFTEKTMRMSWTEPIINEDVFRKTEIKRQF